MKVILIHIPKTAGSAIYLTYKEDLYKYWGHDTRKNDFETYAEYIIKNKNSFSYLKNLFLNNLKKDRIISFAVVRNTWDRVFSSYNYLSKGGLEVMDDKDYKQYVQPYDDFNHFVSDGLEKAYLEQIHFRSQLYWIADKHLNMQVDNVLHFENIDKELEEFMNKNLIKPKKLMVYNKKGSINYKDVYSKPSIKKVEEIYNDEIQKFGFKY